MQICEYMSNDLTLMDINFTLRHSSGHKGKEKADPESLESGPSSKGHYVIRLEPHVDPPNPVPNL